MIKEQNTEHGNVYHKYLLKQFWSLFGGNKNNGSSYDEESKLNALISFSKLKITYRKQQPLHKRRGAFLSRFGGKKCFVCQGHPQCRHHILQLQNGGINARRNIVLLCHACHAKVHPWLK